MTNKYENIIIPKELDIMVKNTIKKDKNKRRLVASFTSVAAALLIFTTSLNVSSTFAETVSTIPVVKDIASVLTFRTYETETEEITSDITIPSVTIEETKLDDYINTTISTEADRILEEAQIRAEEYKDAYLSTGGTKEGYEAKNMTVSVDYEIFTQDENYLSFRVFTHETLAAVYAENLYYTIDLNARKIITLEDLLGENYINEVTSIVVDSIVLDATDNPNKYFDDYKSEDFKVREDLEFYIQENKLFVVFSKYELAAGAFGRLEFEIPMK
jgi:hypothetical protein